MTDWGAYFVGLGALLLAAGLCWAVSVRKRDVSIVDSLWGPLFLIAAAVYAFAGTAGNRTTLVLALVALWALRLATYLTWRNWGEDEDHRYQAIRRRNEPHFWIKSLYLVFALQAVLAWIISLPLAAAIAGGQPVGVLDYAGVVVVLFGLAFETQADLELARFRAAPENSGRVLDAGLWRYSRHPNYFGECCVWWGFYLIAVAAGAWWSVASPLLMSVLLLKVSGVSLLESTISDRRPAYRDYVRRTSAFLPLPPRRLAASRSATEV